MLLSQTISTYKDQKESQPQSCTREKQKSLSFTHLVSELSLILSYYSNITYLMVQPLSDHYTFLSFEERYTNLYLNPVNSESCKNLTLVALLFLSWSE